MKMEWIVMSGGCNPGISYFKSNATGLASEEIAKEIAEHRNNEERASGHSEDDILWFAMAWPVF